MWVCPKSDTSVENKGFGLVEYFPLCTHCKDVMSDPAKTVYFGMLLNLIPHFSSFSQTFEEFPAGQTIECRFLSLLGVTLF